MNIEAERVRNRIELWHLLSEGVKYSNAQLARKVAASEGFVRKWHQQLQDASGDELTVFTIRSRCRKSSPRQVTAALEAKILHVREYPSQQYGRRVGACNILYPLNMDGWSAGDSTTCSRADAQQDLGIGASSHRFCSGASSPDASPSPRTH